MGGNNSLINKGLDDFGNVIEASNKAGKDVFNTIVQAGDDLSSEVARISREGIFLHDTDAFQGEKDEAIADEKQKRAAASKQKSDIEAQAKVKAANVEASRAGTSIILGGKRGKRGGKSSVVSSGLGLSKGATGLQS